MTDNPSSNTTQPAPNGLPLGTEFDYLALADKIKQWGKELGFQQIGISDIDLGEHKLFLQRWLDQGMHGDMHYMQDRQPLRNNPDKLHAKTIRVISARMDYLPPETDTIKLLDHPSKAYISRYALGRDYHKLIRKRLKTLGNQIHAFIQPHRDATSNLSQRPFVDSGPVLERAFAEKAGLGWIGKNTMLINAKAGSWFFLGELFTNLPLPVDEAHTQKHCGSCTACLDICPTKAFTKAFELDARKCISYLTIEYSGIIPEPLRPLIGNRVFGCDDCNLICPWNKFSKPTDEAAFKPRHGLDNASLIELFLWTEEEFEEKTQGSPIRRIGYENWLRNLAIGLGNGEKSAAAIDALTQRKHYSTLVNIHVEWALSQLKVS